jgi:ABC-type transport system substrate-binding protein
LFGALMLLASACAAPPAGNTPAAGSGATSSAPASRQPKTIVGVVGVPIVGLSAFGLYGSANNPSGFFELHSNGLVTSDKSGKPIPQMARELPSLDRGTMRMLDDGRMTTDYSIRPDIYWHDGKQLTIHDYVFGFKVDADPDLPFSDPTAVRRIESIEALDQLSMRITWKEPFYLAGTLGQMLLFPLPAHILEAEYATLDSQSFLNLPYFLTEYVHAGPFRLVKYEPGFGATFEAHDKYFLGRPKIDVFVLKEVLDTNASIAGVLAGEIEMSIDRFDGTTASTLQDQWEALGKGASWSHRGRRRLSRSSSGRST